MNLTFKKGLIEIFPAKKARGAEKGRAFYKLIEHVGKVGVLGERVRNFKPNEIRDIIDLHKKNGFPLYATEYFKKAESLRAGIARKGKARKAAVARWRKKRIKKR